MSKGIVTVTAANIVGEQVLGPTQFPATAKVSDVLLCAENPPDTCEWSVIHGESSFKEVDVQLGSLLVGESLSMELTLVAVESRLKIASEALKYFTANLRSSDDVLAALKLASTPDANVDFAMSQEDLGTRWPLLLKALAMEDGLPGGVGLWFYNCGIGDKNIDAFIQVLRKIPRLENLNLGSNNLEIEGARKLSAWLRNDAPSSLQQIFARRNNFGVEGERMLRAAAAKKPSVQLCLEDMTFPEPKPKVGGQGILDNLPHRLTSENTVFTITEVYDDKQSVNIRFPDGKERHHVKIVEGMLFPDSGSDSSDRD